MNAAFIAMLDYLERGARDQARDPARGRLERPPFGFEKKSERLARSSYRINPKTGKYSPLANVRGVEDVSNTGQTNLVARRARRPKRAVGVKWKWK